MYYKQILISSGEVPEKADYYHTDCGFIWYHTSKGFMNTELTHVIKPEYWLKPIEGSPIDFAKWIDKNFFKSMVHGKYINREVVEGEGFKKYTIEELYDKFLEHGK